MANHKSAKKRIRANDRKRLQNRYYARTMRNALKDVRLTTDRTEALAKIPKVTSLIAKVSKKSVIHKNKAANLKSGLMKEINML